MENSIFMNKWFQWLVIVVGVSVIKGLVSGGLGISAFPGEGFGKLIEARNWAGVIYSLIYDIGEIAKGAYLLRAVGLIEFVKG